MMDVVGTKFDLCGLFVSFVVVGSPFINICTICAVSPRLYPVHVMLIGYQFLPNYLCGWILGLRTYMIQFL